MLYPCLTYNARISAGHQSYFLLKASSCNPCPLSRLLICLSCLGFLSWFACPLLDLQADSRTRVRNGGAPLMPPRYLHLDLPKHVVRNVSRFRLRAHTLAVESSIWRGGNGHCDKCSCAAVQMRCMFFSTAKTCLCALSEESTLPCSSLSANPFPWRPLVFHMPCLVRLFDFLSQRHNRLCHFISDIMDYFLAGEDQQQTNQPNDLAGG